MFGNIQKKYESSKNGGGWEVSFFVKIFKTCSQFEAKNIFLETKEEIEVNILRDGLEICRIRI